MKNYTILILFAIFFLTNCKKKEMVDYIPGTWGVFSYLEDGIDKSNDFALTYQAYKIIFDAKGTYEEFYRYQGVETSIQGTWTLENNNSNLILIDNNPSSLQKMRVYQVTDIITIDAMKLCISNKVYNYHKL